MEETNRKLSFCHTSSDWLIASVFSELLCTESFDWLIDWFTEPLYLQKVHEILFFTLLPFLTSVSPQQIFKVQGHHPMVRAACVRYLARNGRRFQNVGEPFEKKGSAMSSIHPSHRLAPTSNRANYLSYFFHFSVHLRICRWISLQAVRGELKDYLEKMRLPEVTFGEL